MARLKSASPPGVLIPDGSLAWATGELYQGRGKSRVKRPVWKFIPPEDFGTAAKPRTLFAPPHGARNIDSVVPSETLQIIGRSKSAVPSRVSLDLGFSDIEILNGTSIQFSGGGEQTNVGTRLDSPTMGMELYSSNGDVRTVNRPRSTKKKPIRRRSESSYPAMRGVRRVGG